MKLRKRNKPSKIDLLEMPDCERIKLIRAVRESLRQKAVEAKLWKSFLETDDMTINGEQVHSLEEPPMAVTLKNDLLRMH
jgi:hypothetical protein